MVNFTCTIKKFDEQAEKTGWTYIDVPEIIASQLSPGNKKSFRVKGSLDNFNFESFALLPVGGGNFILTINGTTRKALGKGKGATLKVSMAVDTRPVELSAEMMECLSDEPAALAYFNNLSLSHRHYFSKWIESAKTIETKAKRICANGYCLCERATIW